MILQLIHGETLGPYDRERRWQWAGNEEQALLYVPRFRREDAAALRKQVAESAMGNGEIPRRIRACDAGRGIPTRGCRAVLKTTTKRQTQP